MKLSILPLSLVTILKLFAVDGCTNFEWTEFLYNSDMGGIFDCLMTVSDDVVRAKELVNLQGYIGKLLTIYIRMDG